MQQVQLGLGLAHKCSPRFNSGTITIHSANVGLLQVVEVMNPCQNRHWRVAESYLSRYLQRQVGEHSNLDPIDLSHKKDNPSFSRTACPTRELGDKIPTVETYAREEESQRLWPREIQVVAARGTTWLWLKVE